MLRLLAVLLLLTNGAYYAWASGYLRVDGMGPAFLDREPQRLEQQIRPGDLRILLPVKEVSPNEARKVSEAPAEDLVCLQTAILDEHRAALVRTAVSQVLPHGSWSLEPEIVPARWIVYMGKYADAQAVEKKKAELRDRRVSFQALVNPALAPGLSLGSFPTQDAARRALERMTQRGVRTARVVLEKAEMAGQRLRLPQADKALQQQLKTTDPVLAGLALQVCVV